jgi:thioredoxin
MDTHPLAVTKDTFQAEVLDASQPVVVDLWAPWCGPCRAIAPVLDTLAQQYAGRVKVVKINVDEEPELAAAFQVQSIPLVVVVKDRAVIDGQVGFSGAAALGEMFARAAAGPTPAG